MRFRLLVLIAAATGFPSTSFGQVESRVLVIPAGVFAFQPAKDDYGSPYLEGNLGGFGWGGALSVLGERGSLVFGGEITTARHSKELRGRLVRIDENGSLPAVQVTFQETFATGLLGYTVKSRNFQVVGGAGSTLGVPQTEGVTRNPDAAQHWFVVTGGANWFVPVSGQAKLAFGVRYTHVFDQGIFATKGLDNRAFRASIGIAISSSE